jgi:hypothetical protein
MIIVNSRYLMTSPSRLPRPQRVVAAAGFVAGGVLIAWSSYLHFHLWTTGYRHIPTIGPLFLLQTIAGAIVALTIIAVRRVWVAVLGVGFALSTVVGFLVSTGPGLFDFNDSWSAPFARESVVVEIAAVLVLALAATLCVFCGRSTSSILWQTTPGMREGT